MVHPGPVGVTWAKMTLWGVLLTWGVGKEPENSRMSFHSPNSGAGDFCISVEDNWLACMTDTPFYRHHQLLLEPLLD